MRASITAVVFRAALAFGFAATACGGDDSAGNKDQFIAKLCAEYMPCCQAAGRPSDGAQCRAFYSAFVSSAGYDANAASACLDEFRAAGDKKCSGDPDTPSCSKVFARNTGTTKPGDACEQDSDCAPADSGKVVCEHAFINSASVQQCQVQMVGKAGSTPCIATIEGSSSFSAGGDTLPASGYTCDTADGLACDDESGACVALPQIGEMCLSGFYPCVTDAYCSAGTCKGKSEAGFACDSSSACVEGTYCDTEKQLCAASLATGAACTSSTQCASNDCTNGKCSAGNDFSLTLLCGST